MIEAMPSALAPTISIAPAVQAALMVTLVQIVKIMRELGCEPFLGKLEAEIAGKWLHTIEDTLDQMHVIKDL